MLVECKNCHTQAVLPDGVDPHHPELGLICNDAEANGCCTENHHHGDAAGAKEDGGTPCRPITFHVNAPVFFSAQALAALSGEVIK